MAMFAQFIAAMLGVLAFAVLFHAPSRFYIPCGLCGALSWMVYLVVVQEFDAGVGVASLAASLVLAIVSAILAVQMKAPATIFLVTGIFPLVPGSNIYYAAYHMIQGELSTCAEKGVETLLIAGGIAVGLMIGSAFAQTCLKLARQAGKRGRVS